MSEKLHEYKEYDGSIRSSGRQRVRRILNSKRIPKKQIGKNADRFGKRKKNLEGDVCRLGNKQYLITERDEVYDFVTGREITDPNIIAQVFDTDNQIARQQQEESGYDALDYLSELEEVRRIEEHVDEVAQALREADTITRDILCWHLEYTQGQIRPIEKEGIIFYQVGHNASHEFYAGVKEDRKYKYTVGENYDEEGNFYPDEKIYEVDEWGYMGHY
ncbi:hypothetical protein JW752_05120 [Candidatus Peregrinibacteria bacterium]|nr:hypothetical protein [Candidatus Peregrinibacteria bacterium]